MSQKEQQQQKLSKQLAHPCGLCDFHTGSPWPEPEGKEGNGAVHQLYLQTLAKSQGWLWLWEQVNAWMVKCWFWQVPGPHLNDAEEIQSKTKSTKLLG